MTTMPAKVDLKAYRGDTWAQTFRFIDNGVPLDMSGAAVEAWARGTTGADYAMQATIEADPGEVTIAFPAGAVPRDIYDYDVEVQMADTTIRTWVAGRLQVVRDVTNELADALSRDALVRTPAGEVIEVSA